MPYLNLIPWTISAISLLFCILTFARNGKKDTVKAIEEEDKRFDGIKESLLKANFTDVPGRNAGDILYEIYLQKFAVRDIIEGAENRKSGERRERA